MKLTRVGTGPVLEPRSDVPWEKDAVLNAAATLADGTFHLFYRAVSHTPERNRSCIGHAWSADGVRFEREDDPVLRHGIDLSVAAIDHAHRDLAARIE